MSAAGKGLRNEQAKRVDPPSARFHDVTSPWARLKNKDPGRHYVFVYKGSALMGPEYYESIGYEVEFFREGGVSPMGKNDPGSVIERRGHVLMSCTKERQREIDMFGPDGNSGQDFYNQLEKKMIHERGGQDALRGIQGRGLFRVVNETTSAEPE